MFGGRHHAERSPASTRTDFFPPLDIDQFEANCFDANGNKLSLSATATMRRLQALVRLRRTSRSLPVLILNVVATPDDLPAGHPEEGKEKLEAHATALFRNARSAVVINTPDWFNCALLDGTP